MAVSGEAEGRRESNCGSIRRLPGEHWGQVMRGAREGKVVGVAQTTVELHPGTEVLRAKSAVFRACGKRQRPAHTDGISKFPRRTAQLFLGDEVFGEVPAPEVAREDQLAFDFSEAFAAQIAVRCGKVSFGIEPNNFLERFVRS